MTRLGVGRVGQHDPMMIGIERYNKEHMKNNKKAETFVRGRPRSSLYNGVYEGQYQYEPFGKPGVNPTNLITGVAIVIVVVIIIILVSYFIHLKKTGKEQDLEYFDQFSLWGANDEVMNNEPIEVISEEPVFDSMNGGNPESVNNGVDVTNLVSSNKQGAYII